MARIRVLAALAAVLVCATAVAARPEPARSQTTTTRSLRESPCGLPSAHPLWIDFADGSVPFWQLFARPGVIGAGSSPTVLPQLRAAGASTVYFDLYMKYRVGTLAEPLDTQTVIAKSNELYDLAVARTGCQTPVIAENELFGVNFPAPWTAAASAQYRANILTMAKTLADRGAHPYLLVARAPAADSVSAAWWRQLAGYGDIVAEVYFNGRQLYPQGPVAGSRRLRVALRRAIGNFTSMGIPSEKLGIMLGFQVAPGAGGREGLEPASAWFREVKWQALAAKQIAREIPIDSIWSWGWGTWSGSSNDPDKETAACVYLWTRSSSLCDALAVAGPDFNSSTGEGQIQLPPGTRCIFAATRLTNKQVNALASVAGSADAALSALYARAVDSAEAEVPANDVLEVERAVIALRFSGSPAAYKRALARAGASQTIARAVIADELRAREIASRLPVSKPSAAAVERYYHDQGGQPVRLVRVSPAAAWLGGRTRGYALGSIAPRSLFRHATGSEFSVRTLAGTYEVTALGPAVTLDDLTPSAVRGAIRALLGDSARSDAFTAWSVKEQLAALNSTSCVRDQMPLPSAVDLTEALPFLSLREAYP